MLDIEHSLKLLVSQCLRRGDGPIRQLDEHIERDPVVGVEVRVTQSGKDLVHRVPGNTDDTLAARHVAKLGIAIRESANQSSLTRFLTVTQFGNDVIKTLFESLVTSCCKHE